MWKTILTINPMLDSAQVFLQQKDSWVIYGYVLEEGENQERKIWTIRKNKNNFKVL